MFFFNLREIHRIFLEREIQQIDIMAMPFKVQKVPSEEIVLCILHTFRSERTLKKFEIVTYIWKKYK